MTEQKFVEVTWIDSTGFAGWQEKQTPRTATTCRTVGFLVNENDDYITIAATYDSFTDAYHSPLTIPKVAIIERWELEL